MSLPQRPDLTSPKRGERDRHTFRESPRRRRTSDLENTRSNDRNTPRKHTAHSFSRPLPSPGTPVPMERDPVMNPSPSAPAPALGRKRSLVRPERQRFHPDHPNYH